MATTDAPLLGDRQAAPLQSRLLSSIRSKVNLEIVAKMADGLIVAALPVGVASSFYLLASPSSSSPCRTDLNFLKTVLLLMPVGLVMPGVFLTSPMLRGTMWSERPRAHWPIQLLLGVVLATWISSCLLCTPAPPVVLLMGLVVLMVGAAWGYRAVAREEATRLGGY